MERMLHLIHREHALSEAIAPGTQTGGNKLSAKDWRDMWSAMAWIAGLGLLGVLLIAPFGICHRLDEQSAQLKVMAADIAECRQSLDAIKEQ